MDWSYECEYEYIIVLIIFVSAKLLSIHCKIIKTKLLCWVTFNPKLNILRDWFLLDAYYLVDLAMWRIVWGDELLINYACVATCYCFHLAISYHNSKYICIHSVYPYSLVSTKGNRDCRFRACSLHRKSVRMDVFFLPQSNYP